MNEDLKKLILEEDDLLELLLAINFNNKDPNKLTYYETDGDFSEPFKEATYEDINYNITLLNKWKNSNAIELLNEAIKRNPNEATEENINEARGQYEELAEAERELYNAEVKFLKKYLNKTFLNKAYYVFYEEELGASLILITDIVNLFYAINKYKDTPIAEELRNYIKGIIDEKEVNTLRKDILEDIKENKKDYSTFRSNVKAGITLSELVLNASKYAKGCYEDYINKYKNDNGDILEDLGLNSKEPKEVVIDYLLALKNALRLQELYYSLAYEINFKLREVLKKHHIKAEETFNKEDEDTINALRTFKINELTTTFTDANERTKTFKNDAVKELINFFSIDDTTKELVADAIEPRKTKEELRRESYLTFNDLEPVGKEWTKTNVSEYNTALMNLHTKIASYNEDNIEAKERKLNTINYKIEQLEEEDTLDKKQLEELTDLEDEREEAEKDLEETKKRLAEIDKKIIKAEEDLKEASKKLLELENKNLSYRGLRAEKTRLRKEIKSLTININMLRKAKESRGLYLQLAQDEGKTFITATEEFIGGNVVLYLDNNIDITTRFTREATTFLRYLQGQAYNLPFEVYKNQDKPILIDLDNYLMETGRKPSAYKSVRRQLEEAIDLLQKEYYRINGTSKKYNLNITGKIELIGDYYIVEPNEVINGIENTTRKTTFLVSLGSTYKKILFNEKMLQWASIPRLLNRLTNKEIKQKGYENTKLEVVQDLGYYLYETLRKNLNKEGYYKRTFTLKTIVEQLTKSGALATNKTNTYNRRIIEPLEDAFNFLQEELKLITYSTKAFSIYAGDEELGEKGLAGSSEAVIKRAFENAKITITFKVYDKENYDRYKDENLRRQKKAKRIIASKENAKQIELIEDATFIEK